MSADLETGAYCNAKYYGAGLFWHRHIRETEIGSYLYITQVLRLAHIVDCLQTASN